MKGILLILCISSIFCGLDAVLKKYYVQELCYDTAKPTIHLGFENSGIIVALSSDTVENCEITLLPINRWSVVLSIYKYQLQDQDELMIEDSDHHKVALIGNGYFPDEKKAILSDGSITIYYKKNSTFDAYHHQKFVFTYTLTHTDVCSTNEFQCRNKRCISKKLLCDQHNHCGDRSDQETVCDPYTENSRKESENTQEASTSFHANAPVILVIGILVVILSVTLIVFFVCFIRGIKDSKKASRTDIPTVTDAASTNPTPPSETQTAPSVLAQIRRSFRQAKISEEPNLEQFQTKSYQVPSMYPHFPFGAPSAVYQKSEEMKPKEQQSESSHFPSMYPHCLFTPNQKCEQQKPEELQSENSHVTSLYPQFPHESERFEEPKPEETQSQSSQLPNMYPQIPSSENQNPDQNNQENKLSQSSQSLTMYPQISSDENQNSEQENEVEQHSENPLVVSIDPPISPDDSQNPQQDNQEKKPSQSFQALPMYPQISSDENQNSEQENEVDQHSENSVVMSIDPPISDAEHQEPGESKPAEQNSDSTYEVPMCSQLPPTENREPKGPESDQQSESSLIPSMYPHIPSAPDSDGVENLSFEKDE